MIKLWSARTERRQEFGNAKHALSSYIVKKNLGGGGVPEIVEYVPLNSSRVELQHLLNLCELNTT
jgi:hypothetical protein